VHRQTGGGLQALATFRATVFALLESGSGTLVTLVATEFCKESSALLTIVYDNRGMDFFDVPT